jgi:repressor LexA
LRNRNQQKEVNEMPEMDYNPLRGRITELGLTQKECAERIGISESQLNRKFAGAFAFRQDEIDRLCNLLRIEPPEIGKYFFTPKG